MARILNKHEAGKEARDLMLEGVKQMREEAVAKEAEKVTEFQFKAVEETATDADKTTIELQASAIMQLTERLDRVEGVNK